MYIKPRIMKNFTYILFITLCFACGNTKQKTDKIIPKNEVVQRLLQIDSLGQAMHQTDIHNNPNISQEKQELWDSLKLDYDANKEKEALDSASIVWNHFVELCNDEKFDEAVQFYRAPGNHGWFLVHLGASSAMFLFHTDIMFPMIMSCLPKEEGQKEIIKALEFDIIYTERVQSIHNGVTLHYEKLLWLSVDIFKDAELWDKALAAAGKLNNYSALTYGKESYDYATGLFNKGYIYHLKGDKTMALKTVRQAKTYYEKAINSSIKDEYSGQLATALQNTISTISEWENE